MNEFLLLPIETKSQNETVSHTLKFKTVSHLYNPLPTDNSSQSKLLYKEILLHYIGTKEEIIGGTADGFHDFQIKEA